jgi:hypothetical protein
MPVREGPPQPAPPPKDVSPEKARGGEIILRTTTQRAIFIAGLAAAIVLGLIAVLVSFSHS